LQFSEERLWQWEKTIRLDLNSYLLPFEEKSGPYLGGGGHFNELGGIWQWEKAIRLYLNFYLLPFEEKSGPYLGGGGHFDELGGIWQWEKNHQT
jgi:hypothetical protein